MLIRIFFQDQSMLFSRMRTEALTAMTGIDCGATHFRLG
jgi:hypothetical protein